MLDLTKKVLPSKIEIEGSYYPIHTDFQYFINLSLMLAKHEIKNVTDLDFMYIADKPADRQKGIAALISFAFPKRPLPRPMPGGTDAIVFDYEQDADLIFAAFWQQYRIDIMDPGLNLHWYKFRAMLDGLQNTRLNEIMSYRAYNEADNTDYKKSMQRLRNAWEIEMPLSDEEQAELDAFDAQFK